MVGLEGPGQLLMYIIALPRGVLVSYRRTGPGMQDKMVCFLCCRIKSSLRCPDTPCLCVRVRPEFCPSNSL